jgi:hypothetical protein
MTAEERLAEARLDDAMLELYEDVGRETGYWANYFLRDLKKVGGLAVARKLLRSASTSEGFVRLKKEGMLHRSVEALVISTGFRHLFTLEEVEIATNRLRDNGYTTSELQVPRQPAGSPPPELAQLLDRVENAPDQTARWDLRDEVVAFGEDAREAIRGWLAKEYLVPFGLSVLEKMAPTDSAAPRILDTYATMGGKEAALARASLDRIRRRRSGG